MKPALLILLLSTPAAAQTVLFKTPPSAEYICLQNAAAQATAQADKIRELKNVIGQMQVRILLAEAKQPVVKKVKRRRRG